MWVMPNDMLNYIAIWYGGIKYLVNGLHGMVIDGIGMVGKIWLNDIVVE
jgi:hypothetical protein